MQLSYDSNPAAAFAGLRADTGFGDIISALACTRQLSQVVVTTEANSEDFTITINGTAFTFASDTAATKTEIRDGLKALIDAGSEPVSTESVSTDTLLIESTDYDEGFTITVTDGATGVLTLTELVAQEQSIEFGKVVVVDERADADVNTGKLDACRLPRLNADITGGKVLGIALADTSMVTRADEPQGGYSAGQVVSIMRRGRIWVEVEDVASVARGGSVYVRSTASGSEELGAIRAADDGGDTDPLTGAIFTGQVSGDLAVVELNLP
jgi:hypothetical protein